MVEKIAAEFQRDTGREVSAEFSAVGEMKQKVEAGESVDAVILTEILANDGVAYVGRCPRSCR